MRKKLLALLAGLFATFCVQAQYATIPDSSFAYWLRNNGFSACMVGNTIDTNCTYVLNTHAINCYAQPIHNLTGIQYFKGLDSLDCSNDSISIIPALPGNLAFLNCSYNLLDTLPALPSTLVTLYCNFNALTHLPVLPSTLNNLSCANNNLLSLPNLSNLSILDCSNNGSEHWMLPALPFTLQKLTCTGCHLDSLPALPALLKVLRCNNNNIVTLPALPGSLQMLTCFDNQLMSLPVLPPSLTNINCQGNRLASLPELPDGLIYLWCGNNLLASLPALPSALQQLDCTSGLLTSLPALPSSLMQLYCGRNNLDSLPALSSSLTKLYCDHNNLTHFPALPSSLTIIYCSNNNLSTLPAIPASVSNLLCDHNNLTSIPELPDSLNILQCNNNLSLYCLPQLKKINALYFENTNVTCLSDYGTVTTSYPALNTLPLCGEGGTSSCGTYWNISGLVYYDANNNCIMDAGDSVQRNVKVMLYNSDTLVKKVFTGGNGFYSFRVKDYGNYSIAIDTTTLPFKVACPSNGTRTIVLSGTDSLAFSQDFALTCRSTGFDLGVSSIVNENYTARPAAIIPIVTTAGDMSKLFGATCNTGVSGTATLSIAGPARYYGELSLALPPARWNNDSLTNRAGPDTLTWNVADFTRIINNKTFGINIIIDSTAKGGDEVCITVKIKADSTGDYNPSNNSLSYCFAVVNSLDPNTKEVSPTGDTITPQDWLTYTVRFQNTGSAIAQNIVVMDTLDAGLDASSFKAIASGSSYTVQVLNENILRFSFPNINLPDSTIDPTGSHAYIQYKVLPKPGLAPGAVIKNTAFIYFDYNAAMATNPTTTRMAALPPPTVTTGIAPVNSTELSIFPNPASHSLSIRVDNNSVGGKLMILNTAGQLLTQFEILNEGFSIPISYLPGGVYFVKVVNNKGLSTLKKLVVER